MNNLNTRDVVIILLCVIICLGASMFFQPCGPRDDDSWMVCHWAGQAVIGLGCVMTIIGVARCFVDPGVRQGMDIAMIPIAGFTAYIPDNVIMLCKVETMRCHTMFHPIIMLFSVLLVAAIVVDVIMLKKKF